MTMHSFTTISVVFFYSHICLSLIFLDEQAKQLVICDAANVQTCSSLREFREKVHRSKEAKQLYPIIYGGGFRPKFI